jgi:carbonic anhydrase/acetyltransferase-like protein (isoleucine patch superfamily)
VRTLLALARRVQLAVWGRRATTRMKWVGIRLRVEVGEGVVLVRNPFVLAGSGPPTVPGSLTIRLGNRVRLATGVVIEAEPGQDSLLEIGDGTRVGATTQFHLGGGSIRIGASCEIRDRCVLRTSGGGEIELDDRCFMDYGRTMHAPEGVVLHEGASLGDDLSA